MSDVKGCEFYIFNATHTDLSCTVSHQYHDNPAISFKVENLAPQTASKMTPFDTGTKHNDKWGCKKGSVSVSDLVVNVKENNSLVALVVTDWGLTVCPQMNKSGLAGF